MNISDINNLITYYTRPQITMISAGIRHKTLMALNKLKEVLLLEERQQSESQESQHDSDHAKSSH